MKKQYIIIIAIFLLLTPLVISAAANDDSVLMQAGKYLRDFWNSEAQPAANDASEQLAAVYHEQAITKSAVELHRRTRMLLLDETSDDDSDYQIIQMIVESMILVEEAERLGLGATQEEINAMVEEQKRNYEIPEVKEYLDEYCLGAEITTEEYFAYIEQIAPSYISKQKLRDEIGRQYCEEHGLEFTEINPPQEMLDAIDAYIEDLFNSHKDEIIYYIDD